MVPAFTGPCKRKEMRPSTHVGSAALAWPPYHHARLAMYHDDPTMRRVGLTKLPSNWLVRLVAAGVVLPLFVLCLVKADRLAFVALWGLMIAFSWFGWGSLIDRFVVQRGVATFGLRAGWGMAAYLVAAGLLMMLHIATGGVLIALVGCGAAAGVWHIGDVPSAPRPRWFVLLAAVAVAVPYLASLFDDSDWYTYDDAPAYFTFIRELVQTGTIQQPFSLRALQGWGGQSALQALIVAPSAANFAHVHLLDKGICSLIVVAILLELAPNRRHAIASFAAIALFLTLQSPRENSASASSGTAMFLVSYDVLGRIVEQCSLTRATRNLLALVSVATCTLRPNYIPVVAIAVLVTALVCISRQRSRNEAREWMWLVPVVLLMAAPWMVRSLLVFHTPLFPMLSGTFHTEATAMREHFTSKLEGVRLGIALAHRSWGYCAGPAFLAAGIAVGTSRGVGRTIAIVTVATCLGIVAQLFALPAMPDEAHLRYAMPFLVANVLLIIARGSQTVVWPIVAAAVVVHFALHEQTIGQEIDWQVTRAAEGHPSVVVSPEADASYANVQSKLAPHATVFSATDEPFRFDFRQNLIWLIDFPASVAPGDYASWTGDARTLRSYLVGRGGRYLIAQDFDRSTGFYSRARMQKDMHHMWEVIRLAAPAFLRFMDQVDEMKRACTVIAQERGLIALDLESCRF
jgi:hypothetical protein